MYVAHLFLISALLINVRCDCDTYVDCFGDFLREFFTSFELVDEKRNLIDGIKSKVFESNSDHEIPHIDTVLSDITDIIKNIHKNITETNVFYSESENNKTKIAVKTFELGNDFANEDFEETPSTTEVTTTDFDIMEELQLKDVTTTLTPKAVSENISVIPLKSEKENEIADSVDVDFSFDDENFTDYPNIDYIEIYKDTTNEYMEYIPTEPTDTVNDLRTEIDKQENEIQTIIENSFRLLDVQALSNIIENVTNHNLAAKSKIEKEFFPWIATIFLKNESKGNQFDYFCDGAVLSDRAILTAARCVQNDNGTYDAANFIVILGKTSLQASGGEEIISKVKTVKSHENFTLENGVATNDLAILVLEEPVSFNEAISKVTLDDDELPEKLEESTNAFTTAWSVPGDLTLIYFDKEKSKACAKDNKVENTFCATYGNVPFCPSYGGLHVIQRLDQLYLHGIRTGDPLRRGYCITKDITFTSLQGYTNWILNIVDNKDV